jgi:hypothetical protein
MAITKQEDDKKWNVAYLENPSESTEKLPQTTRNW